jgi:hypothetical protein
MMGCQIAFQLVLSIFCVVAVGAIKNQSLKPPELAAITTALAPKFAMSARPLSNAPI